MAPSKEEIRFSVEGLRTHAKDWDAAAGQMEQVGTVVAGLELNRVEAGLFQSLVNQVNSTQQKIEMLAREAVTEMEKGGDALRKVATTYEAEEAKNVHKMNKLY
ncbi:hypothetical protein [Actinocorallia aurantiaca]|uniref:Excreted virulence factor EspC (Type VII ESX diderm) n=1 Tax=Actinocorallia aurantiaca TaxID=46204 RepID=A0ABN3UB66_9ACTN